MAGKIDFTNLGLWLFAYVTIYVFIVVITTITEPISSGNFHLRLYINASIVVFGLGAGIFLFVVERDYNMKKKRAKFKTATVNEIIDALQARINSLERTTKLLANADCLPFHVKATDMLIEELQTLLDWIQGKRD